jgi:hypothetical protein
MKPGAAPGLICYRVTKCNWENDNRLYTRGSGKVEFWLKHSKNT